MDKQQLLDAMPATPVNRYTPKRKALILDAIAGKAISTEEVRALYQISREELASWQKHDDRFGMQGLRTTRYQHYAEIAQYA